jgi:hypothetical protein
MTNYHDKGPAQQLTRSIGVICLSRYLQNLTVTGY